MGRTSSKQDEIYQFLGEFMDKTGHAPSIREIGEAVGLKSTATVHYHLCDLKRLGKIQMDENKKRTITLPGTTYSRQIPVLGVVTAGLPILATENIEGYIPWDGDASCFALRVRGDSMIGAGILDGDKVVVRPQPTAESGQIVVALLGDEATVKRLKRERGSVLLMPENPAYDPIDGREASILGLVKAVIREYA
ncbi:MAG: transcriptional repressor LexA [Oscillospiraceae bacterium]|nr:transcriptional repressor LexA [Oscillospiraceae bacterium]